MNNTLVELNTKSLWLPISDYILDQAWKDSKSYYSDKERQIAFINTLSQKTIITYLQEDLDLDVEIESNNKSIWDLGINGTIIKVNNQSLVLIPSETTDIDEVSIAQELIDIPNLIGDYYLAIQVMSEINLLRVWGYTTHKKIKKENNLENNNYCVEKNKLSEDIRSLWLIQEFCPQVETKAYLEHLPELSSNQITKLLNNINFGKDNSYKEMFSFTQWANIIAQEKYRKILIEYRKLNNSPIVNLGRWLNNQFTESWVDINELISPNYVLSFRDPGIKRVKDLGIEISGVKLALVINVIQLNDKVAIQVSLYPTGEKNVLPYNIKLGIVDEDGEMFKEVTSRCDDEFIRYKFDAEFGDQFSIKISLEDANITEFFYI